MILQGTMNSQNFKFYSDFCPFKYNDNRLLFELYYSFYQNQLKYIKTDAGFETDGLISISIVDLSNNKIAINKDFRVPSIIPDTMSFNKNSTVTGQLNFVLDSGKYSIRIKGTDLNNPVDSTVYQYKNVVLSRYAEGKLSMSGIELCNNISSSSDENSVFYKNTLEVTPNPPVVFGNNFSNLYYYFELYNLLKENITDSFTVLVEINNLKDEKIKTNETINVVSKPSRVEYGVFNINELKTNKYKLIVKIIDNKNNILLTNHKEFEIYNSDTSVLTSKDAESEFLLSEFASYSDDQLNEEFKNADYLCTDKEKEQYSVLKSLDAKRRYLFNFWKHKDISKKEYFDRVKYSNSKFDYNFREGYLTDRGRVYCIYGKPDEIQRFPFQSDTREYEIWNYNTIQGGVVFVFIDFSNEGDYRLVHSTARNETRNDNWQDRLPVIR